jgi:hypothetical protein
MDVVAGVYAATCHRLFKTCANAAKSRNPFEIKYLEFSQRMKWIGIHAVSGSNGPKIKLRIDPLKF